MSNLIRSVNDLPRRQRFQSIESWVASRIARKTDARMMDGPFFNDYRAPFITADIAAVTLATTAKAIVPVSNLPAFGSQYWWQGKKICIRGFGRMTTAATPGNGSWDFYYGTGADANGVILQSSAALALTASQTNLSWWFEVFIHCRSIGSAGTLFCRGKWGANPAVLASTLQPALIPASAAAVSAACDLTAALVISPQFKRSGSTAETMQCHDLEVIALN